MKNKTEKNKPGRVLSLYPWTTSTRTFVNLQLNKSKLSFCKSEILTNVNAAFVATRHGEFTNVSTKARFVFVNVTTSHGLTPISSDNLRTSAKNLISSKSGIPAIVTDSEYGTEKNDKRLRFRPEYKVPTPFRCRKEHYNVPMV